MLILSVTAPRSHQEQPQRAYIDLTTPPPPTHHPMILCLSSIFCYIKSYKYVYTSYKYVYMYNQANQYMYRLQMYTLTCDVLYVPLYFFYVCLLSLSHLMKKTHIIHGHLFFLLYSEFSPLHLDSLLQCRKVFPHQPAYI